MVIVIVRWYIVDGKEDTFKKTWIELMEPQLKKGLCREFFSKPIDSVEEKYHTLDVESQHYRTYMNVGIWRSVNDFEEAIGNFILGRKPHDKDPQKQFMEIFEFEYKLRERIVMRVEETREGEWELPPASLNNKY